MYASIFYTNRFGREASAQLCSPCIHLGSNATSLNLWHNTNQGSITFTMITHQCTHQFFTPTDLGERLHPNFAPPAYTWDPTPLS